MTLAQDERAHYNCGDLTIQLVKLTRRDIINLNKEIIDAGYEEIQFHIDQENFEIEVDSELENDSTFYSLIQPYISDESEIEDSLYNNDLEDYY